MKLSRQDADLFFELMWPLQLFVNRQLRIFPEVRTVNAYLNCSREEKAQVREAMYEHIELIDAFIKQNPQQFSDDKLEIVAGWKDFIAGDFFIERFLKKYAVFIASAEKVYGVLGLYDAFHDLFHPTRLPLRVKAVLLPFQGKIIYDGVLQGYNISFGRGISSDLKEVYMAAKQNGRIIECLGAAAEQVRPHIPLKDWGPELHELVAKANKLRGGSGQPPIYSPAFRLIKASLALAQSAVEEPDNTDNLWECLQKVKLAMGSVKTTLHRSER
ncbi:MAG: hypothetical protein DRP97_00025 [Candidatus Latescibacterota bacterium]|nr:MAG: hypothetical protein DRP97_00025 [Candidatus Latescibacterota bacterium]